MHYWLSHGATKDKLIMAVPTYGRTFTLTDPKSYEIGAATRGPGYAGPYTREQGMLGYNEICEQHMQSKWNVVYDGQICGHYANRDNQWIGFDDIK